MNISMMVPITTSQRRMYAPTGPKCWDSLNVTMSFQTMVLPVSGNSAVKRQCAMMLTKGLYRVNSTNTALVRLSSHDMVYSSFIISRDTS